MNIVIVALIAFVLAYFLLQINKKPKKRKVWVEHGKYHCVSVYFDGESCSAIREYEGHRILSHEAPLLPLSGCDAVKCNCRFSHHEERREEERRGAYNKAASDIAQSTMSITPRSATDRRK